MSKKIIITKIDDDKLMITLPDGNIIRIRGNYGEGCAIQAFDVLENENIECDSQDDFSVAEIILEK